MISNLSKRFANKFLNGGAVSEENYELYVYGLFMLLSRIIFALVTCIFGLILHCFAESLIFYTAFQLIRKYAGGYHAKTETRCTVLSALFLFLCVVVIRLSQSFEIKSYLAIAAFAAAAVIAFLCPADTPEKPLTKKERKYFKKISMMVLLAICLFIVPAYIFELETFLAPFCVSLILEGIMIALGKIKSLGIKGLKQE